MDAYSRPKSKKTRVGCLCAFFSSMKRFLIKIAFYLFLKVGLHDRIRNRFASYFSVEKNVMVVFDHIYALKLSS